MPLGISKRVAGIAPSATLALNAKVNAMKAAGEKVINFAGGEPDFDTPLAIRDATKKALDNGKTRYTAAAGTVELRKAIKDKLKKENDLEYDISQIVVSNGAKHSLFNTFFALLDDGDEAIIPAPCWVSYPEMIQMCGGKVVYLETTEENNFVPKASDIEALITDKTKLFVLTSPSNPNGSSWEKEDLQALADLAVKYDFYIVNDEIYEHLLYDGKTHTSIASLGEGVKDRTIVINGVSKTYAMTGFRIGYAAGPQNVMKAISSCQSQATSAPNTPAQYAAQEALTMPQEVVRKMRDIFEARRNILVEGLNSIEGLSCRKPNGAFYVMLNVKNVIGKHNGDQVIDSCSAYAEQLLDAQKVAIIPGDDFMAPGFCRMSYSTSNEDIEEGIRRIRAFTDSLS